jgi:hypothetical protein
MATLRRDASDDELSVTASEELSDFEDDVRATRARNSRPVGLSRGEGNPIACVPSLCATAR